MALWVPCSHNRDFCFEESRHDDNHTHLKSSEAYRAKLSDVLFRFNSVYSVMLLTDWTHPFGGACSGMDGPKFAGVRLSGGPSEERSGTLQSP